MKLLVFDVGGTEIKYCIIDDDLKVNNYDYVKTPLDSFSSFSDTINSIYHKYMNEIEGIAMALPGFIDVEKGCCNGGGPLVYNHNTNVKKLLEEKIGTKVHIENDAKAAIIAEHQVGSLKGVKDCAVFIIGTGIGGGIVLNNELIRGIHSTAGEFSFVNVDINNWDKQSSCLEYNCSTRSLLNMYKKEKGLEKDIDGRTFFDILDSDEIAKLCLSKVCKNIAIQIYNLGILLDVEKVAIGGGISKQAIVLETIKGEIEKLKKDSAFNMGTGLRFPEIVTCKYYNEANLIGAYLSYKMYI